MTAAAAPVTLSQPSPFAVFRRRSFTLLWFGQLISTIGDSLTLIAAGIVLFERTGSAASLGLLYICSAIPSLVVGLVAGVFVDRYDRKRILISADLIRMVLVVLIPLAISIHIALLFVMVALEAAVSQFFSPALDATLPEVASDEELGAANSLMAISSFGSTAVGFAAGGLIAALGDVELAFYIDAVTFLFSSACTFSAVIPRIAAGEATTVRVVAANLKDGLSLLVKTPILRSLLITAPVVAFSFGMWNALLLPFSFRALHATTFEYGLQEGLTSVGFVLGSLVMARLADRWREGQWLVLGFTGMGILGVAYGLSTSVILAIAAVFLSGFMNSFSNIAGRLIRQRAAPREYRGRVMSAFSVVSSGVTIGGMAFAGLADVIDIRVLVLFASVLLFGVAALAGVLPGLGQPAAEWRRAVQLLRSAPAVGGLQGLRPVTLTDFETLAGLVPAVRSLGAHEREALMTRARVAEAQVGACIVRRGDQSDAAYFILEGRTVAGIPAEDGSYRSLSSMEPGDVFGEIAALTGATRTADVVAETPTTVIELPATTLRTLMSVPAISEMVLSKMSERLARTSVSDLPKFGGLDREGLTSARPADITETAPQPTPAAG